MIFRYLAARLRHLDPVVVSYLNMGLGIETRARRLAPFWAEHLQRTRSAQARWAGQAHGDWLTVLGAGRLLDFNRSVLLPRFQKVRLVDADPLCAATWKTLPKLADPVCLDISGCLNSWLGGLRQVNLPWAETLDLLQHQEAPAAYCAAGSDAILSLNILSQLQIVWQDGVEAYLKKRFGLRFVDAHEEEWLAALRPAGQTLVERHLAALDAKFVLLITDLDYLEYRGKRFAQDRWNPPPVEWSAGAGWKADEGIQCQVSPALEGVVLDGATFARWLPGCRLVWQDCWLWHIAPLGTETASCGKVHRVGAFALER